MASDDDLPPTQSQTQNTEDNIWSNTDVDKDTWGRLVAKNSALKDFDLINETFTAGRANNSDYCFSAPNVPNKWLALLSKTHFKITRNLSDYSNPTYIEDCSRNGTFVKDEKIGHGNKRILAHGDTISISHPSVRAFVFNDHRRSANELPDELSKKYHFGKKLGAGACGTVFLVYDYRTCAAYALKHIKKNLLIDYKHDKALNEAKIMKSITHPCVVQMHDIFDSDDSVYITLELMKGGDLLTRIQSKTFLPEANAKLFFYQICHAIKYLHNRKITHRDLKPDNILLASSDENTLVKISDFGLSKLVNNNSVLRTLCGTPLYVAPEVLLTNGRGEYTEKVDVWSLGVVLFTCLSGTLPFADAYGCPASDQIKRGHFQFRSSNWRHVSSTAKALIRELLTTDVKKRPSIDELLKHKWLQDSFMMSIAHQIMKMSPPETQTESDLEQQTASISNRDETLTNNEVFLKPYERNLPLENIPPSKRRRIY